jgi:hypothetical protein
VRIIAPSQHEDQFVNRKGYHSINVQVVVNADSQFINIVNMAWQEIANIVNAGNSVQRDIKEIQKKWDNICATAKTEVSLHRRSQR